MEGQLRRVRLRLATVVVIIFVFVSSGAFGFEDMVGWSGPGIALLLLLLAADRLGAAHGPRLRGARIRRPRGGRLLRVGQARPRRVLGDSSAAGGRGSPASSTRPCTSPSSGTTSPVLARPRVPTWPGCSGVAIIVVFTYLNIRGLNVIAVSSVVMSDHHRHTLHRDDRPGLRATGTACPWQPFSYPDQSVLTSIGYALAVGMWMYSGYDSMSTLAGEIEEPRRVIPRGLMIAMPIVVASLPPPHARRTRRRGALGRSGAPAGCHVRGDRPGARRGRRWGSPCWWSAVVGQPRPVPGVPGAGRPGPRTPWRRTTCCRRC